MSDASGARHSIAYVPEVTYGTTPATPAFKKLRHTGVTLGLSKDLVESGEIRDDRQVGTSRHGNRKVGGDIEGELSYTSFDEMLEAVLCGTWATNVLKAGTTRRSFTFERNFADIGQYIRYTGCELNSLELSVAPNQMVTVGFGVVGKDQVIAQTAITDSTYAATGTTEPFDSFTGTITEGGVAIGIVTELKLSLENGIEPQFAIGSKTTRRPSIGRSKLSGSMTVFFEDETMLEKFQDETESSIEFTLVDLDGNTVTVELPLTQYNSGQPDVSGEGSVTISIDFQALYSTADASQVVITRTPA
ncbi:MAG: phage tail tube protein [Moraxellaceae bacterium]